MAIAYQQHHRGDNLNDSVGSTQQQQTDDGSMQLAHGSFWKLPREIRDFIYEQAFGSEPRHYAVEAALGDYSPHGFNKIVALKHPSLSKQDECVATGLPTWLLLSKQICNEAMDVFARTRSFEPSFFLGNTADHVASKASINSLLFNVQTFRHITLRPWDWSTTNVQDYIQFRRSNGQFHVAIAFLSRLEALGCKYLCLDTVWHHWWHHGLTLFYTWCNDEYNRLEILDERWNGSFKQVRLLLVYYKHLDYKKDVRQIMMKSAETYAQRLVGAGQEAVTMSWSDEVEKWDAKKKRPCFERYLAVERRV
tara:strand:+ start:14360 stop:15283 length:924 start_codon:yes stop_codon:yes gene_type:complete